MKKASSKLFGVAAFAFGVALLMAVISSVIPASGIGWGILTALLAVLGFLVAGVFAVVGVVVRFTKEAKS